MEEAEFELREARYQAPGARGGEEDGTSEGDGASTVVHGGIGTTADLGRQEQLHRRLFYPVPEVDGAEGQTGRGDEGTATWGMVAI